MVGEDGCAASVSPLTFITLFLAHEKFDLFLQGVNVLVNVFFYTSFPVPYQICGLAASHWFESTTEFGTWEFLIWHVESTFGQLQKFLTPSDAIRSHHRVTSLVGAYFISAISLLMAV